ncbi:hypothetical protein AGR13a_Cc100019 [Agrobacterium genomosp. 13 str. CFBP 6927]|uniref:Uncharacterized protein n=1 Tax=Agrobacterium genomosp. 13 str. CFBP 6927 TaxID=1183428 RepID=A0ABM9V9Z4_9HYPH|nr:hypothetical protein AGR13a_Cc100019 [Agrobacterium genomosp. 13 str. CFBP 6927]
MVDRGAVSTLIMAPVSGIAAFLSKSDKALSLCLGTFPNAERFALFPGMLWKSAGVNASDRERSSFNCHDL